MKLGSKSRSRLLLRSTDLSLMCQHTYPLKNHRQISLLTLSELKGIN